MMGFFLLYRKPIADCYTDCHSEEDEHESRTDKNEKAKQQHWNDHKITPEYIDFMCKNQNITLKVKFILLLLIESLTICGRLLFLNDASSAAARWSPFVEKLELPIDQNESQPLMSNSQLLSSPSYHAPFFF